MLSYIYKIPRSFFIRLSKLTKVFGFTAAFISLLKVLKKPLNIQDVMVSAYNSEVNRDIFFRPATSDVGILEQIFIRRDYDYKIGFEPSFMIDAGAHCGYASIYFLNKFPEIEVIAVEPEKENFSVLMKNLKDLDNVTLLNNALTNKSKKVALSNPDAGSPSFQFKASQGSEGKDSVTIQHILDNYVSDYGNVILKLDIEGAEKDIFLDNPETWINKFDLIFVEPHDWIYPNTEKLILNVASENNLEVNKSGENIVIYKKAK